MSGSELIPWLAWPAGAYLVGSIPFGLLIARARGVDIRKAGSGNIGATNVGRVLGRKWGLLCFALDVLKGFVPVFLAALWLGGAVAMECGDGVAALAAVDGWHGHPAPFAGDHAYGRPLAAERWDSQTALVPAYKPSGVEAQGLWLLVAFGAIAGHVFPVWLRFRGGKGVATSLGCVLGFYPYFTWAGLAALGVWIVVAKLTRYVSVASIAAAAGFPLLFVAACYYFEWPIRTLWPLLAFASAMAAMIIVRHRANIRRLLAGTENKIGGKRA